MSNPNQTLHQACVAYLDEHAMFPDQIEGVMTAFRASEMGATLENRWADPVSTYPAGFASMVCATLDHVAVEWIDANCPAAWFRASFAPVGEFDTALAHTLALINDQQVEPPAPAE